MTVPVASSFMKAARAALCNECFMKMVGLVEFEAVAKTADKAMQDLLGVGTPDNLIVYMQKILVDSSGASDAYAGHSDTISAGCE